MERVVCDSGPLFSAANRRDRAHAFAASIVQQMGRHLLVPIPVIVETDHLLRQRVGTESARRFLATMASGGLTAAFLTPGLLIRAAEFDDRYGDLDLGFTDGSVMAYAERHDLPILTFDFGDFRATRPERGVWRLVVDESRYRDAITR